MNAAYQKIPHRKPVRDCVLQGAGMSLSPMLARSCYSDAELLTKVAANIGLPSNSEVTPDGDIVREFVSPHFVQSEQFGRHNWLFRARWYAPDSPEIRAILG